MPVDITYKSKRSTLQYVVYSVDPCSFITVTELILYPPRFRGKDNVFLGVGGLMKDYVFNRTRDKFKLLP